MQKSLTLVIPVFNEAESLNELYRQIMAVATERDYELDIIFVDDGSSDDSWQVVQSLADQDAHVQGIRFRRNFGKAAALNAAFEIAEGDYIITMDADLQDNPEEIPRLISELETGNEGKGYDVVSGYKQKRHDPWHKVFPSRVFNWMISKLTKVKLHDHNCGLKIYRAEVVREIELYGELHRFVPVLAASRGFRVGEIVVKHRAREFGYSKYGLERFIKGFLDLLTVKFLTGYGQRPQHFLGTIGLIFVAFGGGGLTIIACLWTFTRLFFLFDETSIIFHVSQHPMLAVYSVAALLFGGQLLSIGFLGELITSYSRKNRSSYAISQRTGHKTEQPESQTSAANHHESTN